MGSLFLVWGNGVFSISSVESVKLIVVFVNRLWNEIIVSSVLVMRGLSSVLRLYVSCDSESVCV